MDEIHLSNLTKLTNNYYNSFGRLTEDEEKTLEFYYKLGVVRGVDGFEYVNEAINRASMKQTIKKPISYIASLCKQFYKNGLFNQPFKEENDILDYIQSRVGNLSDDNRKLIQQSISRNGAVQVMASTAEVLNNSDIQDQIINEILLRMVKNWNEPQ